MDEACRRGCQSQGGPRELTFGVDALIVPNCTEIFSNCVSCGNSIGVAGEGGAGTDPHLLVHGWHIIEADVNIFWQQVRPSEGCTTNPLVTGRRLRAGQCASFYVGASDVDGVVVIVFCGNQVPPNNCCPPTRPEGLVRVSRADSILRGSETGDCAGIMSPQPEAGVCEPPLSGTLEIVNCE